MDDSDNLDHIVPVNKRAVRRHHKERMKTRARRITKATRSQSPEVIAASIKDADNLKECSCNTCRNRRHSRYYKSNKGQTIPEIHANDDLRAGIDQQDQ